MNAPVVSVLTPVYKGERYVARAIESVLSQTYPQLELIVVNDGSPDASAGIVRQYTSDPRVTYIEQANAGVAAARNAALLRARGTYIGLCDQDDEWRADKAEKQVALLETNPEIALVHSDVDYVDAEGSPLPHDPYFPVDVRGSAFRRLYMGNPIMTVTAMFRRSVIDEVGSFDPAIRYADDYDLWLRIAARYPIGYSPEPLARYRLHPRNNSRDSIAIRKATLQVLDKTERTGALASGELGPSDRRERRFRLYWQIASFAWQEGAMMTALQYSALAAGTHPWRAIKRSVPNRTKSMVAWYWSRLKRRIP